MRVRYQLEAQASSQAKSSFLAVVSHEIRTPINVISESKKIDIGAETDALVDVPLLGDKNRIKQILDNLVNNAVKFTQDGNVR